jgi:hypothetical protein
MMIVLATRPHPFSPVEWISALIPSR